LALPFSIASTFIRLLGLQVSFHDREQLRMLALLLFPYGLFLLKSYGELQLQPLAFIISKVHGALGCLLLDVLRHSIFLYSL
jgi:hypothetical protein